MIPTILSITLMLYWLLHETDYLRVRLIIGSYQVCEIGECCQWRLPDCAVTQDMKQELIGSWRNGNKKTNLWLSTLETSDSNLLCGWGYAYQYREFEPEYTVELLRPGYHATMHIKDQTIFKDVMRVYRNPYTKVKLA